jgi:molybdenum cofactor biosynthesis protein B
MAVSEHRANAPAAAGVRVAVLTVSDTRTLESDEGGATLERMAREAGYENVERALVPDDVARVRQQVQAWAPDENETHAGADAASVAAVLITGGTGVSPRDTTVDAVEPLFQRRLDGFGELFRLLSFQEIGSAAMLSRATAGIVNGVAVFVMPGSPAAIRLALQRLILPELAHLVGELRRSTGAGGRPHAPPAGSSATGSEHDHHHRR